MPSKIGWLVEIAENYTDAEWFEENAEQIYSTISRGLRDPETMVQTIDTLLLIFPYVVNREDLRRWGKLLKDMQLTFLQEDTASQPRNQPENLFVIIPREKRIRLTRTKRRPREKVVGFEILEIYLTLLMGTLYYEPDRLTERRINDLFALGRVVNHQHMYHKLYQALAMIYNNRGEYARAIEHARLALQYFQRQDIRDPQIQLELGQSAHTLAITYEGLQELEKAAYWLEYATDVFSKSDYPLQHGAAVMALGRVLVRQGDYDEAKSWCRSAVRELQAVDAIYFMGMAEYYLGAVLGYLAEYADARSHLQESFTIWQQLGNTANEAATHYTMAYFEAAAGNQDKALEQVEHSLAILDRLTNDLRNGFNKHQVKQLKEAISKNASLPDLNTNSIS